LDFLDWSQTRIDEMILPYRGRLELARARYEPLGRLGRSFHATFLALEPGADPPAGILLIYELKEERELEDFRFRPGALRIRDGALVGADEPSGDGLSSVAIFVPPLEIEGELRGEAPMILGLGSLRTAPGQGGDGRVWEQVEKEEVSVLAAPVVPSGRFLVRFLPDRVELAFGEGNPVRSVKTRVPEMGRFLLRMVSGGSLDRLTVRGKLESTWASERVRVLAAGG
jgi:hypothetical protein